MGVETTRVTNKELDKRLRELKKGRTVKVGVYGSAASKMHDYKGNKDQKISVLQIAQIHEFGAPSVNIPERSFLRATAREQKRVIIAEQVKLVNAFLMGQVTIEQALGILGLSIVAKIKRRIKAGIDPALKPRTIARKGSSTPLVDTGQLINAINYQVEEQKK